MTESEELLQLCNRGMQARGLGDEKYKKRLLSELKEIEAQAEHAYFLDLVVRKVTYPCNEHNLLVVYLLNIADNFDIDKEFAWVQGEMPDVDMDWLPKVRDYLKSDWAIRQFGRENICAIGTYGTLGIKSAMLDCARVHGLPKDEINPITHRMEDKDDEGNLLSWDKAIELYPDFAEYCKRHPDVASAAQVLIDRNKSGGVHAGGLIISSKRIDDFVPLEVRSVSKENKFGTIVSAWSEGQANQDLQPVGLVKFDMLVVDGLMQIALAADLIKKRHNVNKICALTGQRNWSDIAYLNDPKCIEMANQGDLKCIFQFSGGGIRNLVQRGGVSSFDDLAAYSSIYRPGPLANGMGEIYCNRKRGREQYEIHPLLQPTLGTTYGVMCYQEQVMRILNIVGNIPLIHAEKIRKAISKKKIDAFAKYKEMFIQHGQKNLGVSEEYVQNLWDCIESWSSYGFNKSHSYAYTYISARQLYLKAHYPLEFYTAMLMCEGDTTKIKEYKIDACQHHIELKPVHINKSKTNFNIIDNEIYFGFSNLKGIGEAVAEKIVAGQPYKSFTDFLERFGTEMNVVKCLLALGVFEEDCDRWTMYQFYEQYKNFLWKRKERDKRHEKALEVFQGRLDKMLLDQLGDPEKVRLYNSFSDECATLWEKDLASLELDQPYLYKKEPRLRKVPFTKLLQDIRKKRANSIESQQAKLKGDQQGLSLETFNPDLCKVKIDEKTEMLFIGDTKEAEKQFYGFQWIHELEEIPDYEGYTIEKFLSRTEHGDDTAGPIEVKILGVKAKVSKKGAAYYSVDLEDANSLAGSLTLWTDDYDRFQEEWVSGNLLRIRVKPPFGNFKSFSFEAPPKHLRWKLPKYKDDDCRLYVLKKPEKAKRKVANGADLTFDLNNM